MAVALATVASVVVAARRRVDLEPLLGALPVASAGRVHSDGGPLTVRVDVPARRRVETLRTVRLGTIAATRVDAPGRLVPLTRACGAYVDWYRAYAAAGAP